MSEFVECALGGMEQALPLIPRTEPPPSGHAAPTPSTEVPEHNDNTTGKPGTAFIWGGAAATVAGTGALVTGGVLHVRKRTGTRTDAALGDGQFEEQHARRLTIPLMVGGSVFVAGGVALIIVGVQKNKKHAQRKTVLLPSFTSGFSGLTLQGRF